MLWAERGYLRADDLCAREGVGTLSISEIAPLEQARSRGARRELSELLIAALLATAAGIAVKVGGIAGGVASVPLLAAAHLWLTGLVSRREVSVEALPQSSLALARWERQAFRARAKDAGRQVWGLLALGGSTLVPGGWLGKLGAAGVVAFAVKRLRG